ncbi:MAG: Ldh family oxidoreductase, partial [Candidatus Latescibacteria bacterium]|nr:Ldh family oxidoreductase [Candidatus Latescibacterota bacterium]
HGTRCVSGYARAFLSGQLNPAPRIAVVRDEPNTAVVDGDGGLGHVATARAAELAIAKAKERGVGAVVVRNHGHFGGAGKYTRMALRQGCAAFAEHSRSASVVSGRSSLKILPLDINGDQVPSQRRKPNMARRSQHRFHGDNHRFAVVAEFISERYGRHVHYIADVAGGQGMLCRILRKKYNYDCELVDPRTRALKGVPRLAETLDPSIAEYFDLVVGLHPDEATRAVALAATVRPAILVPCCNFWSSERLGFTDLLLSIEDFYRRNGVVSERVELAFRGPKNIALVSYPFIQGA